MKFDLIILDCKHYFDHPVNSIKELMEVTSNIVEAHIFKIEIDVMKFLLLKRQSNESYPNLWQMVSGAIEGKEMAYEAAIREIVEETGITINKMWVVPNVNSFYSPDKNKLFMVPVFAALTDDENIKISNEHSEYKWVSKEEAVKLLAWPGQRKSVEIIYEYFTKEKNFLEFVEIKL